MDCLYCGDCVWVGLLEVAYDGLFDCVCLFSLNFLFYVLGF